jgi:2-phospho-L-lactate transferase/gluconeogenesis factor (CofD/UPF0052 family)
MVTGRSAPTRRETTDSKVGVVLFSGGRGSGALSKRLVADSSVDLTIAINGYDDGASTGRVRRFLGDCLGPSDFRKNASHLARELCSCEAALVELLDFRLPVGCSAAAARASLALIGSGLAASDGDLLASRVLALAARIEPEHRHAIASRLGAFDHTHAAPGPVFDYTDCAIGNIVFAGCFIAQGRRFNEAAADYCALVGLRPGLIENVTDGTNAYLVALDASGTLLATEEAIVDGNRRNRIRDIFLLASPLGEAELAELSNATDDVCAEYLTRRSQCVRLNPRIADRLAEADLIVYAPGTQHSSLFPSYLTPGLSTAIAGNLTATKLLITNIQADAEITGSSAVDIIERAVYYLKEKARLHIPTPALITHYLINEPDRPGSDGLYVPLGRLDALDDPRLVRIGHYEDGVSGRHDAAKLLTPFLNSFLVRRRPPRVAVVLHDVDSENKLCQTVLEMTRGGIADLACEVTVFHGGLASLDRDFTARLPFAIVGLEAPESSWDDALRDRLCRDGFDYVVLFESSGMYRGEDIIALISPLLLGRLDAVWGSRRLSVRDIEESQRLRYRHNVALRAVSSVGSYVLSLCYLALYGRYVSDTLSGARGMRTSFFLDANIRLTHAQANQQLLSMLMRRRAEIQEVYVWFVALSPERVKRTTVLDGLASLGIILRRRLASRARNERPPASTTS